MSEPVELLGAFEVPIWTIQPDGTRIVERVVRTFCSDCFWRTPHECIAPLRLARGRATDI